MATFGGLAGLGGSSYPQRFGSPNSQQVDYMPDADQWRTDWQNRYDAVAAGGSTPTFRNVQLLPGAIGYNEQVAQEYGQDALAQIRQNLEAAGGNWDQSLYTSTTPTEASQEVRVQTGTQGPDFSALNRERNAMLPLMEQQTRQQQTYDSMNGWDQLNGVMGPNYTDPNFGQINGDFGQSQMGANAHAQPGTGAGIDPSWTSGIFNPNGGLTGVYGSNTSNNKQGFL